MEIPLVRLFTNACFGVWVTLMACNAALAQVPDFGSAIIDGAEQARRKNWEDAERAERLRQMQMQTQAMQRQQAISQNITRYNATGDYRYLFEAAMLGSEPAAQKLRQNNVRCYRTAGIPVCTR